MTPSPAHPATSSNKKIQFPIVYNRDNLMSFKHNITYYNIHPILLILHSLDKHIKLENKEYVEQTIYKQMKMMKKENYIIFIRKIL